MRLPFLWVSIHWYFDLRSCNNWTCAQVHLDITRRDVVKKSTLISNTMKKALQWGTSAQSVEHVHKSNTNNWAVELFVATWRSCDLKIESSMQTTCQCWIHGEMTGAALRKPNLLSLFIACWGVGITGSNYGMPSTCVGFPRSLGLHHTRPLKLSPVQVVASINVKQKLKRIPFPKHREMPNTCKANRKTKAPYALWKRRARNKFSTRRCPSNSWIWLSFWCNGRADMTHVQTPGGHIRKLLWPPCDGMPRSTQTWFIETCSGYNHHIFWKGNANDGCSDAMQYPMKKASTKPQIWRSPGLAECAQTIKSAPCPSARNCVWERIPDKST